MSDISDIDLLKELGEDIELEKPKQYSPEEARLIAGFEDILKFAEENGRAPLHGEERDIFERLYAVRLDQLRKNDKAKSLLETMDEKGLLNEQYEPLDPNIDDDALLAELGQSVEVEPDDITTLRHVSPVKHRRAAEEIANREVCHDFEIFKPLFDNVSSDLKSGVRVAITKTVYGDIEIGHFYILKGQMAYVAEKNDVRKASGKNGLDFRLRVIYDNGTESKLLMSSLQRSFYDPENKVRVISELKSGPLFSEVDENENQTGTIYVLRSHSELPVVLPVRDVILKIGVTGQDVKRRIANAKNQSTYLLGEVEIVDEYKLYNINRVKLERLIQRIFSDARLSITIPDRFGKPVQPNEWFLVTREAVAKAVKLIESGDIQNFKYDHKNAVFMNQNS